MSFGDLINFFFILKISCKEYKLSRLDSYQINPIFKKLILLKNKKIYFDQKIIIILINYYY